MTNFKLQKVILSGIIFSMFFLYGLKVQAATFGDIEYFSEYAKESIITLSEKNIIIGDEKGNFNPHNTVTRSQMITVLVKTLGIDTDNIPEVPTFQDVPRNHWAYKYIEAAYREGIVQGISKAEFGVDKICTREQMATMFTNSLGLKDYNLNNENVYIDKLKDKDSISDWANDAIEFTLASGIMQGKGNLIFDPKGHATREQMAVVTNRFIKDKDKILESYSKSDKNNKIIKIFINEDIQYLDTEPILENEEILVPAKLFYSLGAEISEDLQNGRIYIARPWFDGTEHHYASIKLEVGSVNAYISAGEIIDEFVAINTPPQKIGQEILVPVDLICKTLGAEVIWNKHNNTITIKDGSTVKYPNLRQALQHSNHYKGELDLNMTMNLKNKKYGDDVSLKYLIDGAIHYGNEHLKINTTSISNYKYYNFNSSYDLIKIDYPGPLRYYVKDKEKETFIQTNIWDIREESMLLIDYKYVRYKNGNAIRLLDNNLPSNVVQIQKIDDVALNDVVTTKYTMILEGKDTINDYMDIITFPKVNKLKDFYNGNYYIDDSEVYNIDKFKIDFYVNNQNQIIRESISYNGIKEKRRLYFDQYTGRSGYDISNIIFDVLIDVDYSKIGEDITIEAPIMNDN